MDNIKESFHAKIEPLIDKIGELTRIQRYLIYCGSLFVLIAVFVYTLYLPNQKKISELSDQHDKLTQQLQSTRKKALLLPGLKKKMEEATVQFQIVKKTLPEKEDIPSLLTSISQAGRDSGLDFLLFKPNAEIYKGFYAEIPVSIKVTGNYHNLAMFFDKVASFSRIVNIRDIKLSSGKTSALNISCNAVTYRFVEAKETKKETKKKRGKRR